MKNTLLTALVAGTVSGAVSAVVVCVLLLESDGPVAAPPIASTRADVADAAWIATLEAFERRLAALELVPAPARRTEVATTAEPLAVPIEQAELQAFVASLRQSGDELPASLLTGVENALQHIETERQRERELERSAEREQRIDDRIAQLAPRLGLDNLQVKDVRSAMFAFEEGRAELKRSKGSGGDAKETYRLLKDDFDRALVSALSPAQYEDFKQLRKEEWRASSDDDRKPSKLDKLIDTRKAQKARGRRE